MDQVLADYLAAHPPHHEMAEQWPLQGRMRVHLGLSAAHPPAHLWSSVLAVVLGADGTVMYGSPREDTGNSIAHVLVGGHAEDGETPEQTIIRGVGEETGWRVKPIAMIGYRHFLHLDPFVEGSDRPYPEFIQAVYAVWTTDFDPALILRADELSVGFLPTEVAVQATDAAQRPLLSAALSAAGLS